MLHYGANRHWNIEPCDTLFAQLDGAKVQATLAWYVLTVALPSVQELDVGAPSRFGFRSASWSPGRNPARRDAA